MNWVSLLEETEYNIFINRSNLSTTSADDAYRIYDFQYIFFLK